jgi:hypothetical protein
MRLTWLLIFVALLMLPASATAQHPRSERSGGLKGAIEKLYENREALGLTTDQLTRLQAIKDSSDAKNSPTVQRIMVVRRELKARRAAEPNMPEEQKSELMSQSMAEIRRLMDEIRSNEHAAIRKVGKVLTQEQWRMVVQIIEQNEDDARRRGDSRGRGDRRN